MRIRRRTAAVLAVAAASTLAVGGIAYAITDNVSHTTLAFKPSKLPKKKFHKGKITIHTDTTFADPGNKPAGGWTHRVQLKLDDDFKFNAGNFPKCAGNFSSGTTMAGAMAACGNAKIGSGTASTAPSSNFPGCVLVFNGKPSHKTPTILLFTRVTIPGPTANCSDPAHNTSGQTSLTLKGVLKKINNGDFGWLLDVNNVDSAPLPLDSFTAGIKRGNYVAARCHDGNHKLNSKATFTYSGSGQSPDTASASQKCKVG
jgi:hypothetical protein